MFCRRCPWAVDTDEELVARYREQGDERAFAELVRRHREPVFRLAVSILGQNFVGEAEEVAQEVFLRVHHSLFSFRGEARFSAWIYRVTFNQALNLKARVRYRVPHISYQTLAETASPDGNPVDTIQNIGRDEALADCIARLPEVYQSALRLYYWMGSSIGEVATLLGVPENTVKSYLHRARRLLHTMLEQKGYTDA